MNRRVVITGTGVVSPLGHARDELHRSLCGGRSGFKEASAFSTTGIEHPLVGEITSFQAADYLGSRGLRALNRTSQLLTVAAELAMRDSGWTPELVANQEVGLVVGTMFCSARTISEFDIRALQEGPSRASPLDFANTVINAAAGQAALWHKLTGLNSTISAGSASGVQALGYAFDMIRNGVSRALLAGGVEELCFETLYTFYKSGLLCISPGMQAARPIPFDARRNGFCLGEGAALLMLEEAESASARGATILGELKGYGSAFNSQQRPNQKEDVESAAATMARAIGMALEGGGFAPSDIDAVSAAANGAQWHDLAEAEALSRVFNGRTQSLPVTAIKAMLGESLGASGATQVVTMLAALEDGRLPGIPSLEALDDRCSMLSATNQTRDFAGNHALINALGIDGNCCSLVIGR